jgi:hypothetical protein
MQRIGPDGTLIALLGAAVLDVVVVTALFIRASNSRD